MAKNFGSGVVGGVVLIDPATGQPYKATGGGGGGVSSWNDLEDKPAVIAAGDTTEEARAAIDLADVAASGSYNDLTDTPTIPPTATWSTLDGKPAVIAAGADGAAARTVIGAGTSSLALGSTSGTAKAGDWTPDINEVEGLDDALDAKVPQSLSGDPARFRGVYETAPESLPDPQDGDWIIILTAPGG